MLDKTINLVDDVELSKLKVRLHAYIDSNVVLSDGTSPECVGLAIIYIVKFGGNISEVS